MICISIVNSQRNRTKPKDIAYGLYLYFLGLSYRNAAKALNRFVERSHVSIWKWVQHYKPQRVSYIIEANFLTLSLMKRKLKLAITTFGFGLQSNQSDGKTILGNYISSERNMLIAERFLNSLINKYGKHNISTDGGTWYLSSSL